jgi:hypothetical protein
MNTEVHTPFSAPIQNLLTRKRAHVYTCQRTNAALQPHTEIHSTGWLSLENVAVQRGESGGIGISIGKRKTDIEGAQEHAAFIDCLISGIYTPSLYSCRE